MPRDPESEGPDAAGPGESRWALSATSRRAVPDLVGDRVLELVRTEALMPGDRLPTEPDLARLMGVARSSVRTGLQRLEARGVVEVNRGRGWYVSAQPDRSVADLMLDRLAGQTFEPAEVMEVRLSLEATAAALAAARASRGTIDGILKLASAHQQADPADTAALLRTDEELHEAIVDAAGNAYLRALYGMVTPLIADWRERGFAQPGVHDRSAADHALIVTQLRRQDEVGTRLAMTAHLLGLYRGMARERAAEHPDAPADAPDSAYFDIDDPIYSDTRRVEAPPG